MRRRPADVLLLLGLGALVVALAWRSLGWPMIHDAAVMHYVAWLIGEGAAPYRDVFDMNAPGVYLAHLAVLRTLGLGDLGWRAFDLGWLLLTCTALAACVRPFGTIPAVAGALGFAAYHLAGGAWLAGQRDYLLCVFLLVSAALAGATFDLWRLAGAGFAVGVGITLKPPAALFLLVLVLVVARGALVAGRPWWVGVLAVLAGGAVAPLACAAWLAWTGAVPAFVRVYGEYVGPLYSRLARVGPGTALSWAPYGWRTWAVLAALVALAVPRALGDRRGVLVLAGVGYGLAHFVVQGKGWEYQLYPLAAFACAAAGIALSGPRPLPRAAAVVAVILLALTLWPKGVAAAAPPWIVAKERRVARIAADLAARVPDGAAVQVLDTAEGGAHALLLRRLRQPTRFIYDFHFFHDVDHPVIRGLRAELMRDLRAAPPAAVVLLERGWPAGGYDRLQSFPELVSFLDTYYRLDRDDGEYRIYAKRAGP